MYDGYEGALIGTSSRFVAFNGMLFIVLGAAGLDNIPTGGLDKIPAGGFDAILGAPHLTSICGSSGSGVSLHSKKV